MMNGTRCVGCLIACLSATVILSAFAENRYTWVGGTSGAWCDASNWMDPLGQTGVAYPHTDADQAFISRMTSAEITLSEDISLTRISFESSTAGKPNPVVLRGDHAIACSGTSSPFLIGYYRDVTVDGPRISVANKDVLVYGSLHLLSGGFAVDKDYAYSINAGYNAQIDISGGTFEAWLVPSDCAFRMTGGVCNLLPTKSSFAGVKEWSFTGGELVFAGGLVHPGMLPASADARLVLQSAAAADAKLTDAPPLAADVKVVGGLVVTNGANAGIYAVGAASLTGGGTLYLSRLLLGDVEADLSAICLGASIGFSSDAGVLNVRKPLVLGSIGDWTTVRTPKVAVWGSLTLDTRDAFDHVTMHAVSVDALLPRCGDLAVSGGGAATATIRDFAQPFRSVTVEENTTLALKTYQSANNAALETERLALMAGASLALTLGNNGGKLECFTEPQIAAGAKIKVCVAPGADSTLVYPVVTAPGLSLADFELDSSADGWSLAQSGYSVFLTHGAEPTTKGYYYWTGGAGDCYWQSGANWNTGKAPTESSEVYLCGQADTVLTNDIEHCAVTRIETAVGGTGQFVVRGNPITISGTSTSFASAQVRAGTPMPLVFEVPLTGGDFFRSVAMNGSRIDYAGGLTAPGRFVCAGPTAFGGVTTLGKLEVDQARDVGSSQCMGRPAKMTVLSGGSVTIAGQDATTLVTPLTESKKVAFDVTVFGGGALTVKGAKCGWDIASTLGVDGSLDFLAPLEVSKDLLVSGTGVVSVAAAKATASSVVRIADVTLAPGNWQTVASSEDASPVLRLAIEGETTLSGANGGTYGPADGVEASADRALTVKGGGMLTLDVPSGKTLTFNDPIAAKGDVRLVGDGRLVLGAAGNVFGRLSLEGGRLAVGGSAAEARGEWTPILTARSVTGLDEHADPQFRMRAVEQADGSVVVESKPKTGLMLILR